MHQDEEARLVEKLRKIEGLFARAASAGERAAAESARDRIRQRLEQLEKSERAVEYRFSLPDAWSKSLFIALLRRYGIEPYRYSGQRRTTVMARVTRTFAEEVLWPEYQQLNATLRAHLESVYPASHRSSDPRGPSGRGRASGPGAEGALPAGVSRRQVSGRRFLLKSSSPRRNMLYGAATTGPSTGRRRSSRGVRTISWFQERRPRLWRRSLFTTPEHDARGPAP